jgi:glycosyltransferase involved in cell wall biosynthesis
VPPSDFATADGATHRVLAVGRLVEKKGFAALIDACALCAAELPDFRCDIAGDGPLRAALQARADAAGLRDVVTLTGALASAEIVARMAQAALLIAPSIEAADGDRDGLPNVILEAMACGLPVIATTASAAGEAVVDGVHGRLLPPADPRALAAAILASLRDARWRCEAGRNAREKVCRDFDISLNVDDLLQRFHMAIANTSRDRRP